MSKKRVLIIEDETDMRLLLQRMLEVNDYDVSVAGNIQEGLAMASSFDPAGLILDVNLPDGYGDLEIDHLKAVQPKVNIILISAGNGQLSGTYQSLGAKAFLRKPFQLKDLLNALKVI